MTRHMDAVASGLIKTPTKPVSHPSPWSTSLSLARWHSPHNYAPFLHGAVVCGTSCGWGGVGSRLFVADHPVISAGRQGHQRARRRGGTIRVTRSA